MTVFTFADLAFLANAQDPLYSASGIYPSVDIPFARNKSLTEVISGQSLLTYGLNSSSTFVGSNGLIQTAANNAPRFEHNPLTLESLGVLVEGESTNSIRNSTMQGAVAGTPGTLPTNWAVSSSGGLTTNVVGTGLNNGITYIDLQLTGTTTGTSYILRTAVTGDTPASPSSTWTASAWIALVGGSTSNVSNFSIQIRDNISATSGSVALTSNLIRSSVTRTLSASANGVATTFSMAFSSGAAIDITLRIGLPQLELGASATSVIPTTNAAATRQATLIDLADAARAGAIRSFYAEFRSPAVGVRGVVSLNDGTANERITLCSDGANVRLIVHDGGVEQCNIIGGTTTAGALCRVACRVGANDFAISVNGAAVVADTSGTLPAVDRIFLGRTQAGEFLNGPLARLTGWTESLSDAALRALAA